MLSFRNRPCDVLDEQCACLVESGMPMNAHALCRIFGGAKLDLISKGDQKLTFKDIEGIDQVKEEIRELVEFLKNPKKFIDLARARQLASFSWARPEQARSRTIFTSSAC